MYVVRGYYINSSMKIIVHSYPPPLVSRNTRHYDRSEGKERGKGWAKVTEVV